MANVNVETEEKILQMCCIVYEFVYANIIIPFNVGE